MNIFRYLKDSIRSILYFISLTAVVDLVLIAGGAKGLHLGDLVYMNILMLAVSLIFFGLGYVRWRSDYQEFKNAVDRKTPLAFSLPNGAGMEAELIRETVRIKDEELQEQTRELQNSVEETRDYITKWVHEIKIPISVCELIADRIADDQASEQSAKTSEELRMELSRIKFLVNQVLYTARAASYSEDLVVEELHLHSLVKEAVKRNSAFFIAKNIEVILHSMNFSILSDKKWISYILDQILNNASKYVGIQGRIEFSAQEDPKAVRLAIRDNGIGIAPKDIHRIFDRGFTGDNGRKTAVSTGMGLYLSRKMADRLGHGIDVSSSEGEYTEFTLVFYKLPEYFMELRS